MERRLNRALLKSTNQHLSEDLLSRGVPDLQNRSQHLLTTLFSQQHNYKLRILKIRQTLLTSSRGLNLLKSVTLVSMDVTSLYTNIPQREGITTVCHAYEEFHQGNPPVPTRFLSEMLSLILLENSFQFNETDYLQTHGTAMGTKMAVAFANIFMAKIEKEILRQSSIKPIFWKGLSMTSYQYGTQAETK